MTELTNPRSDRVKAVRALSGRSSRSRHHQFLVEGPQGVRELVRYKPELVRDLYVSGPAAERYSEIVQAAQEAKLYLHLCSEEVIREMSADAQGMVAVANMPETTLAPELIEGATNIAVLCQVRDPGNAGTIVRAADAAGADLVILAGDSVDVLNPKVVRSTAGSLFHLPVVTSADITELSHMLKQAGIQVFAAAGNAEFDLDELLDAASDESSDLSQGSAPDMKLPTAWLFGNEAKGLSDLEFSAADFTVSVPIRGKAESLNVATAATVCLYATSRAQR